MADFTATGVVDFAGTNNQSGSTTIDGAATVVVMGWGGYSHSSSISGTYNGLGPDEKITAVNPDDDTACLMCWGNPTVGSSVGWATTGSGVSDSCHGSVYGVTGADGDAVETTGFSAIGIDTGDAPSIALSTEVDDLVVFCCEGFTGGGAEDWSMNGETEVTDTYVADGVDTQVCTGYQKATGASVTVNPTLSGGDGQAACAGVVPTGEAASVSLVVPNRFVTRLPHLRM